MRLFSIIAAAFVATLVIAGCNDYGNTFQVPTGASVTSISPADASAGGPGFTLTVNGSGFVAKTVVQWNQQTIPTTVTLDANGNVTLITATVSASLIAKTGSASVQTLSPHSGAGTNGLSNPINFIINPPPNPVPTLSGISPNSAPAGSPSLTLTITGSNFLPTSDPSGGSKVNWNAGPTQTTLTASSISASSIQATVNASLLSTAGCAVVTVFNPPAPQTTPPGSVPNPTAGGGGTSPNGASFTISSTTGPPVTCPAPAVKTAATAATSAQLVAEETPAVSTDGRYVAYSAVQNAHSQVFVRDTCEGAASGCQPRTTLLSAATDGVAGNDDSKSPSMSSDGRYVAFSSAATNLVSDAPAGRQVYLHDTCSGVAASTCTPTTQLISTDSNGALTGTESILPSVSSSGRYIAFLAVTPSHASAASSASKSATTSSAAGTNSGYRQVFVRDTCLGASSCTPKTTRISLQPGDVPIASAKPAGPALSGAASHVAASDAMAATVFTRSVAVDDRIFLAATSSH